MAPATGMTPLIDELVEHGHEFSFVQVMRLARRYLDSDGEAGIPGIPWQERVRIRPELSLAFPAADVAKVERDGDNLRVTATFLGLYGPSSPLPTFYTEDLMEESSNDESVFRDFLDIDEAFFQKVYAINLESVLWMCQRMIEARKKKGGVIINVSSIEAILPFKKGMVHYDTSKAGVIGLTRSLARDFGDKGFRINVLLPGGIITQGTKGAATEFFKGNISLAKTGYDFLTRIPMARLGEPDEIARATLFLALDLSSYITGALLAVDGGFLSA